MGVDPETEICVTCGSTEAMIATMLGVLDPGDEVVVFEPFYENYGPDAILSGAVPRLVTLRPPDWTLDEAELRAAFSDRTRAVVINTPNNPTGKVFSRGGAGGDRGALCARTTRSRSPTRSTSTSCTTASSTSRWPRSRAWTDRTVTISALSKTYSVTGWRVGWAVAPAPLMAGIRPVHDFLTVAAAAPLQVAGITALELPASYYEEMVAGYAARREAMHADPRRGRLRGSAAVGCLLRDGGLLAPGAR